MRRSLIPTGLSVLTLALTACGTATTTTSPSTSASATSTPSTSTTTSLDDGSGMVPAPNGTCPETNPDIDLSALWSQSSGDTGDDPSAIAPISTDATALDATQTREVLNRLCHVSETIKTLHVSIQSVKPTLNATNDIQLDPDTSDPSAMDITTDRTRGIGIITASGSSSSSVTFVHKPGITQISTPDAAQMDLPKAETDMVGFLQTADPYVMAETLISLAESKGVGTNLHQLTNDNAHQQTYELRDASDETTIYRMVLDKDSGQMLSWTPISGADMNNTTSTYKIVDSNMDVVVPTLINPITVPNSAIVNPVTKKPMTIKHS